MAKRTETHHAVTQDVPSLLAALRGRGIRHLAVAEAVAGYAEIDNATLIARLAGHTDPRLREALIPLFMRHPPIRNLAKPAYETWPATMRPNRVSIG